MQVDAIVSEIRYHHRKRVFAVENRKRLDLALMSILRMMLGWSRALPKAERDAINAQARAIAAGEIAEGFDHLAELVEANVVARGPMAAVERNAEKAMTTLAGELAVAAWWQANVGKSLLGLAIIIGEAGDVGGYGNPAKLWKRMGVGLVDGVRQGGLKKTAPKADWIRHGYNRSRRSRLYTIGDSLIKKQGAWRELYLARKDYERARAEARGLTVVPAARIPKARAAEFMADGHVHRRAQRYMEKRLLRDLWRAWRAAASDAPPKRDLPLADPSRDHTESVTHPTLVAPPPADDAASPSQCLPAAPLSDDPDDQKDRDVHDSLVARSSGPAATGSLSPRRTSPPADTSEAA